MAFRLRQISGRDEILDMTEADYAAGHVGLTRQPNLFWGRIESFMKIRLALAILMGTVALGMGQTTSPTFDAIAETPTTITVLLQAGSDPINGFDIYWKGAGTRWQVSRFYDGLDCARSYALQPGENIAVIIGIETTGDFCRTDSWLHGLKNCTQYLMYAVPHHGSTPTNVTIGETTGCSP